MSSKTHLGFMDMSEETRHFDDEKLEGDKPPEKWFSLFGLVVVRKTDLLAATAFALSASAILFQLWEFMRGASPSIYYPDTVYVYFDRYANGITATRFAGQISFTNSGASGHNTV